LRQLSCDNNPLVCLPFLPNSLIAVNISGTLFFNTFGCLPNIPTSTGSGAPICTSSAAICIGSTWANGKVYRDANTNGQYDISDQLLSGFVISNTTNGFNSLSASNGYNIEVDSGIPTNIALNNPNSTAWNIVPASHSVTAIGNGQIPGSYDFGLQAVGSVHNLSANIANQRARPGFQTSATATFRNVGNQLENNLEVKIVIPNGWAYNSSILSSYWLDV
jgi:hypothetical protein